MSTLTEEDIDFMKWLDQPNNNKYWSTNENNEIIITRDNWNKAYNEYIQINHLLNDHYIGLPPPKYQRQEN